MSFFRPTDIAGKQKLLDTQPPFHVTERHERDTDLCTDPGCALWLILPQREPAHCFSETGEYQGRYIYRGWS